MLFELSFFFLFNTQKVRVFHISICRPLPFFLMPHLCVFVHLHQSYCLLALGQVSTPL